MTRGLRDVRAVIFDVDGVLLDARASYHAAADEAARRAIAAAVGEAAARAVPFERSSEVARFKAAGAFNDDWEMARGIALLLLMRVRGEAPPLDAFLSAAQGQGVAGLYRAFPPPAEIAPLLAQERVSRLCGALYGGRARCKELFGFAAEDALPGAPERGSCENEVPLADPALVDALALRHPFALFTGRNPAEAELACARLGLRIPARLRWVADGRPRKPDGEGLVWLCRELFSGRPGAAVLFVGDTADDQAAARDAQAREAPLIYAHIEAPGDTNRVLARLLAEGAKESA